MIAYPLIALLLAIAVFFGFYAARKRREARLLAQDRPAPTEQ